MFASGLRSLENRYLAVKEWQQVCRAWCSILVKDASKNADSSMIANVQPFYKFV